MSVEYVVYPRVHHTVNVNIGTYLNIVMKFTEVTELSVNLLK